MYKLIFITAVFFSSFVYSQERIKKAQFAVEPEINYSFVENKIITDDSYRQGIAFGGGVTFLAQFNLNKHISLLTGLKVDLKAYNYKFIDLKYNSRNFGLSLPAYFQYHFSRPFALGIGTELSFGTSANITFSGTDTITNISIIVATDFAKTLVSPIILYGSYYLPSKKGRTSSLTLYFRKGIQTYWHTTMEKFVSGNLNSTSSFNFKGSNISISYRYYFGKKNEGK